MGGEITEIGEECEDRKTKPSCIWGGGLNCKWTFAPREVMAVSSWQAKVRVKTRCKGRNGEKVLDWQNGRISQEVTVNEWRH